MNAKPLSSDDLLRLGVEVGEIPAERVLATFADPLNWVQIYHGETSPRSNYTAKTCEWAFIGPSRPPFELAQWALNNERQNR